MDFTEISSFIEKMPDEVLEHIRFSASMPWQIAETSRADPDGKPDTSSNLPGEESRKELQEECWRKFIVNPQVNTSIRGVMGRLTGMGFETGSYIPEINDVIREIEYDYRNRLYNYWPKWVGRSVIEGELFLPVTCHPDGFIEVDFIDPVLIDDDGILFHSEKKLMPLFYNVGTGSNYKQIPSIYIARNPGLAAYADKYKVNADAQKGSRNPSPQFKKFGGYNQFIISWDRGLCTNRAISYLRTTIEWLNHYENLKKYEIDHKKSCGSYTWVFKFEDARAFKQWLSLSDAERAKTGVMQKFSPGCRLFLPPGMSIEAKAPVLPNISESDTDILQMASSGLNEPVDVMMGSQNSTFAAAKASRGPMSDRISDEIAWFERFLKFDFWGSIFFLKSALTGFPRTFKIEEVVAFKKGKEVVKRVPRAPEFLIDIDFPISEVIDMESRMRAIAGSKHAGLSESLGLPHSFAARRLGVGSYGLQRLRKATEDRRYPKLVKSFDALDVESASEKSGAEGKQNERRADGDDDE